MHGRTGLKKQLEDLRDSDAIRDDLVRYLGNPSDVQFYGVLVRDVEPHQDDLRARARVDDLGAECPEGTSIELLAPYLPRGSLEGIGEEMVSRRAGGER